MELWGRNTTTITAPIITHVYTNPGVYTVTLEVYSPGATPETDTTSQLKTVLSPPIPVGGVWTPANKLKLLVPYFGLASTALIATVVTTVFVKRREKKQ